MRDYFRSMLSWQHVSIDDFPFKRACMHNQLLLLTQELIEHTLHTACDFFGIPYPAMIADLTNRQNGQTMFVNTDSSSYSDDILCYNLRQLQLLGVSNEGAFSLVMTHECAHRVYQRTQFGGPFNGSWAEELACDYYMGVRAVMDQLNIQGVLNGIRNASGGTSHPDGDLRQDVILFGKESVLRLLAIGIPCTFENLHKEIIVYLTRKGRELELRAQRYTSNYIKI